MTLPRCQRAGPLALMLLVSCSPPPDQARDFRAMGTGYVVASPETGVEASFDQDGAWLGRGAARLGVQTARWGRAGALQPMVDRAPALGACAPGLEDLAGSCVRRLEYGGDGITAWWSGTDDGLQQGWTVEAPPAGPGHLVVDVAIAGARVAADVGHLRLHGVSGVGWRVWGLTAWDANGRVLPTQFKQIPGGFQVAVDDGGARYPIEIDPVYTTDFTTLTGEAEFDRFGTSVAGAGDVNGDGYEDVIVGAYGYGDKQEGRAYVYLGSPGGVEPTASTTLTGEETSEFGTAVAGAGDVNGDGYDDVIVGAPGHAYRGIVAIYHGSASGVSDTATTVITDATSASSFGAAVSGAGDVNGDGYDDVVFGDYGYDSSTGRVWIHHGSASGVSTTAATTLSGASTSYFLGMSVSAAGDVDGDGYGDVIVGAYGYSLFRGQAYVFHGSAAGVSTTATTTLSGEISGDRFGYALSGAGDVNGDGYSEVVVGADGYSSDTGRVYLFSGSASGVSSTASTMITGEGVGYGLAGAGDADSDGYDDVILNADGRVDLYPGTPTGLSAVPVTTLTDETGTCLGTVAGAGDVNGDGHDDVILGNEGFASYTGCAAVHHGYPLTDDDEDGYSEDDCDDGDPNIHPGGVETCDGIDQDCDGEIDEDATDFQTWYADADGDGYTDAEVSVEDCAAPDGYVAGSAQPDCDDGDDTVWPGAEEVSGDGVDQDCDGVDLVPDSGGETAGEQDTGEVTAKPPTGEDCGCGTTEPAQGAHTLGGLALIVISRRRLRASRVAQVSFLAALHRVVR